MSELPKQPRCSTTQSSKKPMKIAMRLSSLSSATRKEMSDYLLIERPPGRVWSNTTYKQRMESRPPLQTDLEGPTPCTYSARLPAPSVHGTKINPRAKYDRGVLPGYNPEPWTHKLTLKEQTPSPFSYTSPNVFGQGCPGVRESPAFSLTARRIPPPRHHVEDRPGPQSYNSAKSLDYTLNCYPSYTMATRRHRTRSMPSPGPAHYFPCYSLIKTQPPAFSIQQRRQTRTL